LNSKGSWEQEKTVTCASVEAILVSAAETEWPILLQAKNAVFFGNPPYDLKKFHRNSEISLAYAAAALMLVARL
jgi:hypothetical protein